jgi:NADH-quinone oxidoreductase subunit M
LPILPLGAKAWLPLLAWLCLGNILYCGWVAMRQKDLNLLIGNSSVAHVGFVFLGLASLTTTGLTGAVVIMVAHGFLAALSFALSGWLHAQTGSLEMSRMGGLLRQLPFAGSLMVMAMMAGCGLPGFGSFVGEMMVLFGGWNSTLAICGGAVSIRWLVAAAAWGALIVAAVYMLRGIRVMFHGAVAEAWTSVADLSGAWRKLPYLLLLGGLLAVGVWPRLVTDPAGAAVRPLAEAVERSRPAPNLAVSAAATAPAVPPAALP